MRGAGSVVTGALQTGPAGISRGRRDAGCDAPRVLEAARDDAQVIVRERNRMHALHGERAVRGFEAERAAVRSRTQRRALGLRAERGGNHPCADRRARSARRAAGRAPRVERVAAFVRLAAREGGRHGLAHDDRAARAQRVHARRIPARLPALVERVAHLGRQVAVSMMSFTPIGMPSTADSGLPLR